MILRTATGKTFNFKWEGVAFDNVLYFGVDAKGASFELIIQVFTNPEETKVLDFYTDDKEPATNLHNEYTGYTRFVSIRIDTIQNVIVVGLGKEFMNG